MRKVFAILAFFCLLLITGGYQLLLYLRIAEAKQQMKTDLVQGNYSSPSVIQLTFTESQLKDISWEDESEFEYKEVMYDVLKQESVQGKMVIWCVQDKKETALIEDYIKTQKQSSSEKNSHPVLKLLSVQFISTQQNPVVAPLQLKQQQFEHYFVSIPFFEKAITTPPPRLA